MKEPKEPAASRPVGGDDVLEVMRQLEESNAGMYLQAEQMLAQAAANDRSNKGGGVAGGVAANGVDGEEALGGLSGVSPVKAVVAADAAPKFSPSQYLMVGS